MSRETRAFLDASGKTRRRARPFAEDREVWTRQPRESSRAHQAFLMYRDLGPGRAIMIVAERLHRHLSTVGRWCAMWSWIYRCEQWDKAVDRERLQGEREAARKMLDRHRGLEVLIVQKVLARLRGVPDAGIEAIDPNSLDAQDVAKLADVGVKIGRLAYGLSDSDEPEPPRGPVEVQIVYVDGDVRTPLAPPARRTTNGD